VLAERLDTLPVVHVGWFDALAFAEWAGKRLPSYPEWIWAARGAEARHYPWGDELPTAEIGNAFQPLSTLGSAGRWPLYEKLAKPVDSCRDACTPSGIHHLYGNVAEWTESVFAERIGDRFEPRPFERVIAGDDWSAGTRGCSLVNAYAHERTERSYASFELGFRCASSQSP
jgi:iron(II)-dependent oxidoreductase